MKPPEYKSKFKIFMFKNGQGIRFVFSVSLVLLAGFGGIFIASKFADAAATNFVQSSWVGGVSTNIATGALNQTGWSQYIASVGATGGADARVELTNRTFTSAGIPSGNGTKKPSGGGFYYGTVTNTEVSTVGSQKRIELAKSLPATYSLTGAPSDSVFDKLSNSIWVADNTNSFIDKININDGTLSVSYPVLSVGCPVSALAFDNFTNSVWVISNNCNTIEKVDATNGAIATSTSAGVYSQKIAFDPSTNSIWVTDSSNIVTHFDTSGTVLGQYPVGTSPLGIGFSPGAVWVANSGDGTVTKLNSSTGAVIGTYPVGLNPQSIAYDSDTNSIWTTNAGDNTISKVSAGSGALVGSYIVGNNPAGIAFDSVTNSMWVTNNNDNTLVDIKAASGFLSGSDLIGGGPLTVVFDDVTKSVWAINSFDNTISKVSIPETYAASGTFLSNIINFGEPTTFTTLAFTASIPPNTTLTMDVRAGNTVTPDATWTPWITNVSNMGSLSALSGNHYFQYRANLATTDTTVTPTINDVTISSPYWYFIDNGNASQYAIGVPVVAGGSFSSGSGTGAILSGSGASTTVALYTATSTNVSAGYSSGYSLQSDGTVWSWGYNTSGELGNNTNTQSLVPVKASVITGATQVTGGEYTAYALKSDGTVWSWGAASYGQLGNGSATASSFPVQVTGLTGVTAISNGYSSGYALKSDGTVWAWGYNTDGELGNNSTTNSFVPVQVSGLTGVTAISGGQMNAYALKSDGTVWSWGNNSYGQLGNGTTTQSSVPVQVTGLTGMTAVAGAGGNFAYALKSDGTLWAWGRNISGQLGNNSIVDSNVPVQVSGLTGVIAVSGGGSSGYAVKSDGTVWSWGLNSVGQLGNNSTVDSLIPIQVSGLTGATSISGKGSSVYALKSDGTVWAWGYNADGELGNNTTTSSSVPLQITGLMGGVTFSAGTYSGMFSSGLINLGGGIASTTLSYNATVPPLTGLTIDVRGSLDNITWSPWILNVPNGGSLSALDNDSYLDYRVNFTTTSLSVTPILNSVTFNYKQYRLTGVLTSSVYDSGSANNTISKISWVVSNSTTLNHATFQIRSSPDGVNWSDWCYSQACDGNSYFQSADNGVALPAGHPLTIPGSNRYFQYRIFLGAPMPVSIPINPS